jgi:hypothetical protein
MSVVEVVDRTELSSAEKHQSEKERENNKQRILSGDILCFPVRKCTQPAKNEKRISLP